MPSARPRTNTRQVFLHDLSTLPVERVFAPLLVVAEALGTVHRASSPASLGGVVPHGYDADAGYPGLKMSRPWFPPRLNFRVELSGPGLIDGGEVEDRALEPSKSQTTLTDAVSVAVRPLGPVTRTAMVRSPGPGDRPPRRSADWPGVSKCRHRRGPTRRSACRRRADPVALTSPAPSATAYGPPASTVEPRRGQADDDRVVVGRAVRTRVVEACRPGWPT